ncbi:hypothetical protein NP233_g7509 [Leucocoprinus birnbaumii]|uniref:Uncharacterized protein n=1 Tax=Leucocoprinus birnbaumii TaxID=56174 RepID=A0AAD5YPX0_9AGAR|nr:hypothetical protein NP233_g7509 [Leucocoprinus birnbaumii]
MLSDSRFAQVIHNLRDANTFFYAEARCYRAFHQPTHHAKRRAIRLNLKVDTHKAHNLPTMQAYCRQDPEIIQTYSPIFEPNAQVDTNSSMSGPSASDLLNVNAALSEHLARTRIAYRPSALRNEIVYPSSGYEGNSLHRRPHPDVPSDIVACPGLAHSSSSSRSSSTVTTPENQDRPVMIRINLKRRSPCDVEETQDYVEKRPKYGRKRWAAAPVPF